MFSASIDNKKSVKDPNDNNILNLPASPFFRNSEITSYRMKVVPSDYTMRPDLISLIELGTVDKTEYIMMFNQIGNPFSINEDDVLLIPDALSADAVVIPYNDGTATTSISDDEIQEILVQNYYRYAGREDYVDMSSYDKFFNTTIPSGNTDEKTPQTKIPYMLNDEEESMIIKNGKIYFNNPNDVALNEELNEDVDIDSQIASILDDVATDLSCYNCSYNGTNLSDFIKALNNADMKKNCINDSENVQ